MLILILYSGDNQQSLPNEETEPSYSIESVQPEQKDMEEIDINFAGRG